MTYDSPRESDESAAACVHRSSFPFLRAVASRSLNFDQPLISPCTLLLPWCFGLRRSRPALTVFMVLTSPALRRAISSAQRAHDSTATLDDAVAPQDTYTHTEPVKVRDSHPLDAESDEVQLPIGTRDWTYWAALCFAVVPVYSVVPLSWAYTLYTFRRLYLKETLQYWELSLLGYTLFEVSGLCAREAGVYR